ncbi:MAG TPA: PhoH family protein [Bacteroidales bacterium]|jgi:PhoH-like ATPase|nr:PhoH family protein [Bacteroidales bacterium]MDY0159843.1 PhoH family protein [Bacteroidales bacterium]HXK82647.1 PhoH family protein [Bacteroidales bacterium]
MSKASKLFVLDTNVLLHDFQCLFNFQENDVVIPIVVLEELDKFKKGNDLINFHAREFTRVLDDLTGEDLFEGGVKLGDNLGKLFVETGKPFTKELENSFPEKIPDHRILSIAQYLKDKHTNRQVVLVTKDINLRLKAKSLGLIAQDYKNDKVANIDNIKKEVQIIEGVDKEVISRLYSEPEGIPVEDLKLDFTPLSHQYFVLKNGSNSALAHYDPFRKIIDRVVKTAAYGIEPRNAEQAFAIDALLRPDIQLVALTGKAGTGKTLLALATALQQRKSFLQIFLARPIVALSNKDIGFLPGDAKEKINPYMQPLFDNLSVIKHKFNQQSADFRRIDDMLKSDKLLIEPLAYIRGRSLSRVFFIIDEAQNLTPHEVKTIITRAGEGAKIVFTGDIQQIDSPYLDSISNGLSYLAEKMRGQDIFAHIHLIKGERSYLAELASDLL